MVGLLCGPSLMDAPRLASQQRPSRSGSSRGFPSGFNMAPGFLAPWTSRQGLERDVTLQTLNNLAIREASPGKGRGTVGTQSRPA